jgi:D-glycero-D-manno-heptose 1,7-bisphosphate phosphatase
MGKGCVFFDRDGVINVSPGEGYVLSPAELRIQDGIAEAIGVARAAGLLAVVVTNQRCVGRGLLSEVGLEAIHRELREGLARRGAVLDGLYVCTATDDSCPRRKPQPGMFLEAADELGIDLAGSWMVGDQDSDFLAATRAGLAGERMVRLRSGKRSVWPVAHELAEPRALAPLLARLLLGTGDPDSEQG